MNRVQHPSNNAVLAAPPGAKADEVTAIAVTHVVYADGVQAVLSFWQPTTEELRLLNLGRPVRFGIFGTTHAPVYLGVDGDGLMPWDSD